jgi:Cu+-exporting ATPase
MNPTTHTEHSHTDYPHGHDEAQSSGSQANDETALKDPVCGMAVSAQSIHRSEHMGHNFFFCGPKCKAKFDANPMQYMRSLGNSSPAAPQPVPVADGTIYTCPMHPEVRQDHPGNCPKCGMTLEPMLPSLDDDNPELRDFQRRFWWTLPLTVIVFVLAMFGHRLQWMDMRVQSWVEFALATPIVLWAGWPFLPAVGNR